MQNDFILKRRDGQTFRRKFELLVLGFHNNLPYSAVALTVSYPVGVVTQLILDGKIKERGVLMPESDVVIDAVFKAVILYFKLAWKWKNLHYWRKDIACEILNQYSSRIIYKLKRTISILLLLSFILWTTNRIEYNTIYSIF